MPLKAAYGLMLSASKALGMRALAAAASRRPRLVRAQRTAYDPKRQYLLAAHPHGILNYGWWNLISRYGLIPLLHPLSPICGTPVSPPYIKN